MDRIWPALVCCLLSTACSSKKSASSAAEDIFTEVCGHVSTCCSRGEADFYLGPYTSEETCVDRLVDAARRGEVSLGPGPFLPSHLQIPNLQALESAISEGRMAIDGKALDACVEWLQALSCNTTVPAEEGCQPPDAPVDTPCHMELIFRGQVQAGEPCSSPGTRLECREDLACRTFDILGVLGICAEPGLVDDFCYTDGECRPDLYCRQLDGTCQLPHEEGEDCRYADPNDPAPPDSTLLVECASGLSCDPLSDTCVAACQQGAVCDLDEDCDQEQGLSCILSRCDLPRPLGLPCAIDEDCQENYRCEVDPVHPPQRICLPLIVNGQPCPFGAHNECASHFCHPFAGVCDAQVAPPGLCPTGLDMQCAGGYCDTTFIACAATDECPVAMNCNVAAGHCEYICTPLVADGDACDRPEQCASTVCVDDVCRTFPIPNGGPCSSNGECASNFCGLEVPRTCDQLPLADGRMCNQSAQCSSEVCFAGECVQGLMEGASCQDLLQPPCGANLYCDHQADAPTCVPLQDAGGTCEADYQCRGDCVEAWSRPMCDPTPPTGGAICDGG
jgi:hypothetical protein